jgi:hypothetical protein
MKLCLLISWLIPCNGSSGGSTDKASFTAAKFSITTTTGPTIPLPDVAVARKCLVQSFRQTLPPGWKLTSVKAASSGRPIGSDFVVDYKVTAASAVTTDSMIPFHQQEEEMLMWVEPFVLEHLFCGCMKVDDCSLDITSVDLRVHKEE